MNKLLLSIFVLAIINLAPSTSQAQNYPKKSPEQLQAWCNQFIGSSATQSYRYRDYLGNEVTRNADFKIIQCKHDGAFPWILTEKQDGDPRKVYRFLLMFRRGSDHTLVPDSSDVQLGDCPARLGDYLIEYYHENHISLPPDFDEVLRANARDQICPAIRSGALSITLARLTN
jgi:hypothetical protein